MTDDDTEPALVRMGAGSDDSTRNVNLNVSGTVGPDHLGQQTTTVDGHWADRPGVRSRVPEQGGEDDHGHVDPRIARMDTGEELPVLLSSSMKADPIEGVQGSYTQIVEGTCARCGYDRLKVSVATLAGETQEKCNACGAIQDGRSDNGYRMPSTQKDRTEREIKSGRHLVNLSASADAYDMEPDTGYGPYVSIVGNNSITRIHKDDVADMFFALAAQDDIDIGAELNERAPLYQRATLAVDLLPDDAEIGIEDDEDGENDE